MNVDDIDQVCEIEKLSFTTPWSRESFESELSKNSLAKYFVVKIEGRVAAYGGIWIVLDEGHITNIAVHPDFSGRQIGEKIAQRLLQAAKESMAVHVTLEVRTSNDVARNLYKKLGFVDSGMRKGYYADTGEDAVIMWKELT
jgi:ribosomal-protein-alanine N-acetyltransferase